MVSSLPGRSGASNEICSRSFSITVYRRRAPMFSVLVFTCIAISAIASTASGANRRVTCSVFRSSTYCVISAFRGSVRMRTKSSRVKGSSSTRIGKRPWSSGIRSDAFAADVGAMAPFPSGDLVELVQEDDARVLGAPDGLRHRLVHVHELLGLLLGQEPARLRHPHLPAFGLGRHDVREHVLEVDAHLFHALPGEHLDHRQRLLLHLELDQPVVEQALCRELLGPLLHAGRHLRLDHVDRQLGQVADHRLDVATDVADLRVLGGLDLQERCLRELRQPARHLGLPDAGGPDHDDVLRRDFVAQLGRKVLPSPPVAQRDRHRALGLLLADDVTIELGDDLRGREGEVRVHSTSTVKWSLVKTQIVAATRMASVAIALASRSEFEISARAAASAYGPPEPMPIRPSSGSMTSPVPETMNECSRSATARSASSRRSTRSERQSLASSTAARERFPRCSSSLASKRAKSVKASAAAPANPASTRSP